MTAVESPLETGWLADTPVGDTVLRRFLLNQAAVNAAVAEARGGRVEAHDHVHLSSAGAVDAFLNQAVLLRPVGAPGEQVLDAIDDFAGAHALLVLSIWPTPDLAHRGWQLVGHPTFVVKGPGRLGGTRRPGVVVREVGDARDLRSFEQVVVDGYPSQPAADGAPAFADGVLATGLRLRLALVEGRPVAAAMGHVSHGVVNLCLAATLPEARRRGAWSALVRARVDDEPSLPAVAFTSDDSRPGFERMGFLPVTRFTLWLRPPTIS